MAATSSTNALQTSTWINIQIEERPSLYNIHSSPQLGIEVSNNYSELTERVARCSRQVIEIEKSSGVIDVLEGLFRKNSFDSKEWIVLHNRILSIEIRLDTQNKFLEEIEGNLALECCCGIIIPCFSFLFTCGMCCCGKGVIEANKQHSLDLLALKQRQFEKLSMQITNREKVLDFKGARVLLNNIERVFRQFRLQFLSSTLEPEVTRLNSKLIQLENELERLLKQSIQLEEIDRGLKVDDQTDYLSDPDFTNLTRLDQQRKQILSDSRSSILWNSVIELKNQLSIIENVIQANSTQSRTKTELDIERTISRQSFLRDSEIALQVLLRMSVIINQLVADFTADKRNEVANVLSTFYDSIGGRALMFIESESVYKTLEILINVYKQDFYFERNFYWTAVSHTYGIIMKSSFIFKNMIFRENTLERSCPNGYRSKIRYKVTEILDQPQVFYQEFPNAASKGIELLAIVDHVKTSTRIFTKDFNSNPDILDQVKASTIIFKRDFNLDDDDSCDSFIENEIKGNINQIPIILMSFMKFVAEMDSHNFAKSFLNNLSFPDSLKEIVLEYVLGEKVLKDEIIPNRECLDDTKR